MRLNYRTTEETRRWAVSLLEGASIDDLDGGLDNQRGYKSLLHGLIPEIRHFDAFKEEVNFLARRLGQIEKEADFAVVSISD